MNPTGSPEQDMQQTSSANVQFFGRLMRPSVHCGRLLADHLAPALLFASAAFLRCINLLTHVRNGPADPSLQTWLAHLLQAAHHAVAFLFLALIATLFLVRRAPRGGRAGPLQMAIALGGTFVMYIAAVQPATTQDWRVLAAADVLLVLGSGFTIYAAASLRYCFGLAPEARGLVTTGAYRLVRHPLYLGEFVALLGVLLPVLAPSTLVVYALFCVLQATRAALEERVLSATFQDYVNYRRRTPALLPWPRPSC
jgi:protein-S-isoprenylcysteine O-methyltransferase Ste14